MKSAFLSNPTIYVARDLERAMGLPLNTVNYYIISNFSAFGKRVAGGRKNVLLVKSGRVLDTRELLNHPRAKAFINRVCHPRENGDPVVNVIAKTLDSRLRGNDKKINILVFKPTLAIEKICADNGWKLLNPPAKLAAQVEEKISQVKWLGPLAKKLLPPFEIKECGQIKWSGKKFILQFNFAHTGQGTFLVENEKQLNAIKKKFPLRSARVTKYIVGSMFTNNNVVWDKKILIGNINYQITGLKPFTNNPFATIGNDWALPHKILTGAQKKQYEIIARTVGERLAKSGWKGLFGIDVIMEEKTGKLYLIEINARQPASTAYESQLQQLTCHPRESGNPVACHCEPAERRAKQSLTTFTAHLLALFGQKYQGQTLIKIKIGAQIVQKVGVGIAKNLSNKKTKEIEKRGFKILSYDNIKSESDKLRFQTVNNLMAGHNKFNESASFLAKSLGKF